MGTPRPKPAVFRHTSQTQWGRAVVAATGEDRTTYMFEHAGARTFKNGQNRRFQTRSWPAITACVIWSASSSLAS